MILEVIPAYGRTYQDETQAKTAWRNCEDFKIVSADHPNYGAYVTADDLWFDLDDKVTFVNIRNQAQQLLAVIDVRSEHDQALAKPDYSI